MGEFDDLIAVYGDYDVVNSSGFAKYFKSKTNSEGIVLFANLEPRQYWFKITKDSKTNAGTTFKTDSPLPDNSEIINLLDVGIQ